jgi:ribose transport system substrate-binding protein
MKKRLATAISLTAAMALLLAACSSGTTENVTAESAAPGETAESEAMDPLTDVEAASLTPSTIMGVGPYGEISADVSSADLTDAEIKAIRALNIEVGIVMQTMDIEWSTEQVRGITDQVEFLGGSVVNVCDGQWDTTKQTACIDTMITLNPDAIISIPVDDVGMAPTYAKISEAGIKLIFIDNVAKGLEFPSQYQGMVTSDNQGNGAFAAASLAAYIPDDGVVGILDFAVDFFVTKERTIGFQKWMDANRPDITVKVVGFQDTAKAGDIASNFLTANPDVQGMFTVWEVPAMGILTALRSQGKSMPVTLVNVASDVATDLASGGMVKAVGAQRPYDEGVAEANFAARALIGGTNPSYLAFPAAPFLRNNTLEVWQEIYKSEAPQAIQDACASGVCGSAK